jgi:hypothetical protein
MDGEAKTEASGGYVPLHPVLADHLRRWRSQTPHKKDQDFVFPSLIPRHSRIQTTLDLYNQGDNDEARGAQAKFLRAVGVSGKVQ